jgi:MAF protein
MVYHDIPDLVLASASPRRKELFSLFGLDFKVFPAEIEEKSRRGEVAPDYVLRLAEEKAKWVAAHQDKSALIVAADTTVVDNGQILGKPIDDKDAEQILRQLRGKVHRVYSGIAISGKGKSISDLCETVVPMRNYSDQEIQEYIDSGDPLDKAGAYAIQHPGFHPVDYLEGCYANVMGLPLCHLARAMSQVGVKVLHNLPFICQEHIKYSCSIYHRIL